MDLQNKLELLLLFLFVHATYSAIGQQPDEDTQVQKSDEEPRLPNTDDLVPNYTTPFPPYTLIRIRNQRLSMLRSYVLETLGFSSPPRIHNNRPDYRNILSQYQEQKVIESRCYLPSCSLPNRINYTLWTEVDQNTMNLYFDVIHFDENTHVINATLKLRVKPYACNDCDSEFSEPKRIIVSVSQYVKPLKRRKRKTKMMSASMVVWSGAGHWASFSVTEAAREWTSDNRKNNGFLVRIQTIADSLNITDVFSQPDCTAPLDIDCSSTDVPFPFSTRSSANLEIITEGNVFK